jgi:hypothetical protein
MSAPMEQGPSPEANHGTAAIQQAALFAGLAALALFAAAVLGMVMVLSAPPSGNPGPASNPVLTTARITGGVIRQLLLAALAWQILRFGSAARSFNRAPDSPRNLIGLLHSQARVWRTAGMVIILILTVEFGTRLASIETVHSSSAPAGTKP